MKTFFKIITLSGALFGAGLLLGNDTQASTSNIFPTEVKAQVNDSLVPFQDAQPVMVDNEVLFVPIRPLAQEAGYDLEWELNDDQAIVTFTYEGKSVTVKTGDNTAMIDGTPVHLEIAPFKSDGYTYVPFRFIAEAFGHIVQWDDENLIAILGEDGQYHAPAWYRPAPASELSSQIIETAKKYLGVKYVYGGSSPSSGFDCSGFIQYVFKQYGIDLPRTAAGMYQAGTHTDHPEPGDLVFFKEGKKVSHVGIYVGKNQYIDAASGKRMKVTYSSLSSSWSKKYYIGAKKVL